MHDNLLDDGCTVYEMAAACVYCFEHRADREDITIIIWDTKLVPDFVLHTCCFFIAGDRPILKPPLSTNKSLTHGNRAPKS